MIVFAIYILSVAAGWLWIHLAYSRGGRMQHCEVETHEVVLMFVPAVNTLLAAILWATHWPMKTDRSSAYNKFFRIKK